MNEPIFTIFGWLSYIMGQAPSEAIGSLLSTGSDVTQKQLIMSVKSVKKKLAVHPEEAEALCRQQHGC